MGEDQTRGPVGNDVSSPSQEASYRALDWVIRTWIPTWLDQADLEDTAEELRQLDPIRDDATARAAGRLITRAAVEAEEAYRFSGPAVVAVDGKGRHLSTATRVRTATVRAATESMLVPFCAIARHGVDPHIVDVARRAGWAASAAANGAAARSAVLDAGAAPKELPFMLVKAGDDPASSSKVTNWSAVWAAAGDAADEALQPTIAQLEASATALREAIRTGSSQG